MPDNQLTLAVAGARKTQGIVEACVAAPPQERILVLTYTTANQDELRRRIASQVGLRPAIEVMGWFTFLIRHFVKPALPFVYSGVRVTGFDFDSMPQQYASNDAYERYFNSEAQVRRVHLAQLATRISDASQNAAVACLSRIYDTIYIDEAQDLCGYDLEILLRLMKAPIALHMVGDVRQAVLLTNEREKKHKRYQYMKIWDWFREQQKKGQLHIEQRAETWRCRQEIASFADSLFDASWAFTPTTSINTACTDHDGLFLVHETDVPAYLEQFDPLLLRQSANSAKNKPYDFMNFRVSKGLSRLRVMIWPTSNICKFLQSSTRLEDRAAAEFYVAVTRAEQSVAIVLNTPGESPIPYWRP
ncbi:UvrD-helicase domain-containing protein [Actinophytocola gossypii]|uniref:UvrD-helicase domain-containing protein n=1 Tax=Actinophytocola gossypii TaxID=2812003 RepID=A0ABT2J2A2_9PSEU|nr:UvrD-helicase domain-containing protein [Actinophytocola gossypii]MCT2581734.1 UvrD-helicase domain-containing protein [Actinophytocola gossypii]